MTKKIVGLALAVVSASYAQYGYPNGGYGNNTGYGYNGSGKCTVEVEIDRAADVFVTGANVQIRNLAGGPAMLVRNNCSAPLPFTPAGFQFRGIDGRGRQMLVADPNSNRGTAVVRLEDPDGGRERYTFDLIWSGNNAGYNTGTYGNSAYGYPVYGGNYPNNSYPVYGNSYPASGYPVYGNANPYPVNGYPVYRTPPGHRRGHRDNDGDDDDRPGRNRRD